MSKKRLIPMLVVAVLALAVAAPAMANAPQGRVATAHIAKKKCKRGWVLRHGKCKKKKVPVYVPPAPPAPLPLTDSEVIARVSQQANFYCSIDIGCNASGYYYDTNNPSQAACSFRTTYQWGCYGWNDEFYFSYGLTCDFREIVDRVGYNGITSHQDLSYGWNCYYLFGKQRPLPPNLKS